MSFIDFARSLQSRAVERLHPQRVVFHHVPKCGGTSVGRALRKRYLLSQATIHPESSFKAFEAVAGVHDRDTLLRDVVGLREQMLLYLLFEDVRCVSAHVRFSEKAYELFKDRYRFITILREPVSRFISNYRWSLGKVGDHGRIDLPLEEFVDTERARRLGAIYVQYFGGLPSDADLYSKSSVERAIRNLAQLDVVGQLQDLGGFQAAVRRTVGVNLRIGHENRSRDVSTDPFASLEPKLQARIAEVCAPDLAIWRSIRDSAPSEQPM